MDLLVILELNLTHAWSLINVNGKWYPFDATWGILSGKLAVCHVFQKDNKEEK